jgi:hypothetical protein
MSKQYTFSEEDLAKIITVTIFGYNVGTGKNPLDAAQRDLLYKATLEQIKEGGFLEELVTIYDNNFFDKVEEEVDKLEHLGVGG